MPFIPSAALLSTGETLPFINVKDAPYRATGDGVTDDTAAIQAVFEVIRVAGGGTAFFPVGNYRLATSGNSLAALTVGASNITLQGQGPGSRLFSELGSHGVMAIQGAAKATGSYPSGASSQYQRKTVFPMSSALAGAASVTLTTVADASRFAVGDYIYFRTGQANGNTSADEPLAEINRVKGIASAVISLSWPLAQSYSQEYFPTGVATTLTAAATSGSATIAVTSAAGFAAFDYITIKGATGEADHQGVVQSVASNNITMFQSPDKTIPSAGAIVSKVTGSGMTTTTVTAYPAAFGVTSVQEITIENVSIRDMKIQNTFSAVTAVRVDQVVNFDMTNSLMMVRKGGILGNKDAFMRLYNNRFDCKPVAMEQAFVMGLGSGSGYVSFIGNHLSSEGFGGVTVSEGTAAVTISNNVLVLNGGGGTDYPINIQTRSGPTIITDNHITSSGSAAPIFTDLSTTIGGVIDGNILRGTGGMNVQGDNWLIGPSNKMVLGSINLLDPDREPSAVTAPQYLSAWFTSSNTTVVLGILPVNAIVTAAWADVLVLFNGAGVKDCVVGIQGGTANQYVTTAAAPSDWGTAGVKIATLGALAGHYNSTPRIVEGVFSGTGSSQGKALIVVEYRIVPQSP